MVMLLILFAVSASLIGNLLACRFSDEILVRYNVSMEIVIFIFTASAGAIVIFNYIRSIESEDNYRRWRIITLLDERYRQFREKNITIIYAVEYPHILNRDYLPLCKKSLDYDQADFTDKENLMNKTEMIRIRELDDFIEFFETIYCSIKQGLVNKEDFLIYFEYWVVILGDIYYNPEFNIIQKYIDNYYFIIKPLLVTLENAIMIKRKKLNSITSYYYPRSS